MDIFHSLLYYDLASQITIPIVVDDLSMPEQYRLCMLKTHTCSDFILNVRIINPQSTHLDINLIISILLAQFMCPTLCKLSFTYPQWSNLPHLTHVVHGKAQGIKSALFLASQVPFYFFCFIPCFFSVLRQIEKLYQVR